MSVGQIVLVGDRNNFSLVLNNLVNTLWSKKRRLSKHSIVIQPRDWLHYWPRDDHVTDMHIVLPRILNKSVIDNLIGSLHRFSQLSFFVCPTSMQALAGARVQTCPLSSGLSVP